MGADAAVWGPLLGSAAMGGLGAIFAPEGQDLSSFENTATDPKNEAQRVGNLLNNYLSVAMAEAGRPVTANTTVHPLPSFSGGGLPFDIGASAVDPNRLDASRRTLPGIEAYATGTNVHGPTPRPLPIPEDGDEDPGPISRPYDEPPPLTLEPQPGYFGPSQEDEIPTLGSSPSDVSGGYDLSQFGGGDLSDLDQAEGAIALLLKQLGQG